MEQIIYDDTSSSRFKLIKRHETKLKWIKLLQYLFPLGFNDNNHKEGNILEIPDFIFGNFLIFIFGNFHKKT